MEVRKGIPIVLIRLSFEPAIPIYSAIVTELDCFAEVGTQLGKQRMERLQTLHITYMYQNYSCFSAQCIQWRSMSPIRYMNTLG